MLGTLVACLFAMAFFAALPLWALTLQDGRLHFRGGGNPWRCTVTRTVLFHTDERTYEPEHIVSEQGELSASGHLSTAWQLEFKVGGHYVKLLRSYTPDKQIYRLANELEQARATGQDIERELPPDGAYYVTLAVACLFAAAGAFLVLRR